MAGFLQKLYAKVYINVVVENHYADISVRIEKMGRVLRRERSRFEIKDGVLTQKVANFIERYERKSPFSYVSVLNPVLQQGATPGCSSENMKGKVWLCASKKKNPWSIYVDASYLQEVQKKFAVTGIDYIFSPFSIIPMVCKEIRQDKAQLFVFVLEKMMSITVFRNNTLEFAKQISLEEPINEFDIGDEELMLDDDLSIEGDDSMDIDIDIDEEKDVSLDGLEDLEGLEDLDGLDELDELNTLGEDEPLEDFTDESSESEEEEGLEENLEEDDESPSLSGFSRNFRRFEFIQESIHEFYHASDVESSFIENVYVLDPYEDCEDLRSYLEDELFVTVHFRNFNLNDKILELVKDEIKDAS